MARRRDERPEWVVEVEVSAIAVLTVRADSHAEACAIAEEKVRPVDVREVRETTALRVVRVGTSDAEALAAKVEDAPQTASKAADRGRQA